MYMYYSNNHSGMCFHPSFVTVCLVSSSGSIQALNPKSVLGQDVLREISTWLSEGCLMKDVIVRQRTVPAGYSYHTWIPGLY